MIDGETTREVSKDEIKHILTDLPPKIDMHILDGPYIIKGVTENPGYTGIEVIDKSHISIHTFTENNVISIDVYSCKHFHAKKVVQYIKNQIEFKEITTRTITREIIR